MCGGYLLNKSVYLLNYVETLIKESVYLVGKGVHLLYRASVAGAKFNKLSHFLQSFGTKGTHTSWQESVGVRQVKISL